MKFLFDENLSPDLAQDLSSDYPGSAHVRDLGLRSATDLAVWERARVDGYTLVSKASDFRQMSFHSLLPRQSQVWSQSLHRR